MLFFWTLLYALSGFPAAKTYTVKYVYQTPIAFLSQNAVMKANVRVVAREGSTLISFSDFTTGGGDVSISMNRPDSTIYTGSKWFSFTDGKRTEIPFEKMTVTETKETKMLQGYKVQKLIIKAEDKLSEWWVCRSLPATITPMSGYRLLPGAVLEFRIPAEKVSVVISAPLVIEAGSNKK